MDLAILKTPPAVRTMIIHGEECREVEGCYMYVISESGKVYRTEPWSDWEIHLQNTTPDFSYFHELKVQYLQKRGYKNYRIVMMDNEKRLKNWSIPHLVMKTFVGIPKYFNNLTDNFQFIDGDINNNHYSNIKIVRGGSKFFKLTIEQVRQIRNELKEGYTLKALGKKYGVSDMQIYRIKSGECWNKGKLKIVARKTPFYIAHGKIRRNLAQYETTPVSKHIRKPFMIKRNPDDATDNFIVGILNGYKFRIHHKNITRAKKIVEGFNAYFFNE